MISAEAKISYGSGAANTFSTRKVNGKESQPLFEL
jgi:hypothetical protein